MGFKNAHARAGFFEKLKQQGQYKDNSSGSPAVPKISAPKISAPKAPSIAAPKVPKVANTFGSLANTMKPISAAPKLQDAMPDSGTSPAEPVVGKIRFKKLKRLF